MIREVLRMGDARLLRRAAPVEQFDTPALHALLADMRDTMHRLNGVGLAAPQIGVSLRVAIFGFERSSRYPEAESVPDTVLINPELTILSADCVDGWEGCLSVPGLRGQVPRYRLLHYAGFDEFGKRVERTAGGFHARVVQHECDHLDGVLYPMRMNDLSRLAFVDVPDGVSE